MRFKKILALVILCAVSFSVKAGEVYRNDHVRFTLIDGGTIRLEYAPDGKFVDNKSFIAVVRDYDAVKYSISESGNKVTITTDKMKVVYTKTPGGFTEKNLTITNVKGKSSVNYVWHPGMKQKGNLKGTYRTLDQYNGDHIMGEIDDKMPIEDGILATDGWTLLDDSEGLLFDGAKDWDWVTERKSAKGAQDWYFMSYGHDYKAALKSYTKFAGKVPIPPRYAFGYWWSRWWSYSDQDLRNLVGWFKKSDIPLDIVVIDMDWHPISEEAGGGWTGWDWNEHIFPDYKGLLKFFDENGIKTTMNLHPADGVRPFEKKYKEFASRIGMPEGETREWLGSDKQYMKAIFDTYLHSYMDDGVDFWWLDWQQWLNDKEIPALSNTWWCNYVFFTDMERRNLNRPLLYHRWGGLGNHRYQVGFSGDSYITWESLNFLPYFNSTSSNVLYGYWSHDIGGFYNPERGRAMPQELYIRSMQLGKYLPILRTHCTKDAGLKKEPWSFPHETQERLKAAVHGRYSLVPYIYTAARQDYETGISLCRPMYYDYPEDKEAYDFRNQFMFGDYMMIAPITAPIASEDKFSRPTVWLPKGEWFEYETGTMVKGPKTVERAFNIDEFPVYIKSGSILPYYDKLYNLNGTEQPVIVRVFPGGEKGEFSMYEDNGNDCNYDKNYATTMLSYNRNGNTLTVKIAPRQGQYPDMPAKRHYTLALPCALSPQSITMNGSPVEFKYEGNALETVADLGMVDCAAGAEIVIKYADANNDLVDGLKARMNHIVNAVADYKQHDPRMVYTDSIGYMESTPLRLTYFPDRQREIINKFEDLYENINDVIDGQIENGFRKAAFLKMLNLTGSKELDAKKD
ncbi:MAG: DUF5110 domain-containing protein [Bacteroidales bacterium]|nr:DUF5110 domain-containing protein [Candidatus Sodaliphilus aphodohippi]